ncbi:MAG: ribose-phosphate pyrophosphokinase [Candidatus Aenigmarchaeota archaeon]|nr:ribose-phosphate pyrophosphokinase [Candidatus Aenigmarchaeota archaeon]
MAIIVPGSNSKRLAERISFKTGIPLLGKAVRKFPDGETYVRLDRGDLKDDKVFIVHTLYPDQNENLMELFLTIGAVKESGGRPIPVIPYFAYGRQDRIFQRGESLSLKSMANILRCLGVERVLTVDSHFNRKEGDFDLFGIKVTNISAVTLQISHARKVLKGGFTVVGPDEGSVDFLSGVSGAMFLGKKKYCPVCGKPATKCECKSRKKEYVTRPIVPSDLVNKNVLLLDDMISSGATIIEAVKALKAKGNRVCVGCTHGLFVGGSLPALKRLADGVFSTDTVESEVGEISVAGMIAKEMDKMK